MKTLKYGNESFKLDETGNDDWLAQVENGDFPGLVSIQSVSGVVHVNLSESVPFAVIDRTKTSGSNALPRGVAGTPRFGTDQF